MYNYPTEKLTEVFTTLEACKCLVSKISYLNRELIHVEYCMYLITTNKNLSTEEKKSSMYELNILYDEMNLSFKILTHEHFVFFKKGVVLNLQKFPYDIRITYLNGLLKQLKDNELYGDEIEDKSVEIFLNNELRKQKIKKLLND